MEKLLLVDGSNLLFQMFYGMPARIPGPNGRPIHGTLGFVGALLKILGMVQPAHGAVLFDGEHENPRSLLDGDYKANRTDYSALAEEETPFSQLPDIYAALDYLGIRHAETRDCEVDDWIAAYARCWDGELVIASQDSDYFQLVSDRVQVLRYRGKLTKLWGVEAVEEKFGVHPSRYADFKALVGDGSDNIPGAKKVGPKTAASLLAEFGTLDGILENWERISKPAIRESIRESAQRLRQNDRLIRLAGDAELPFPPEELGYCVPKTSTFAVLRAIGLR